MRAPGVERRPVPHLNKGWAVATVRASRVVTPLERLLYELHQNRLAVACFVRRGPRNPLNWVTRCLLSRASARRNGMSDTRRGGLPGGGPAGVDRHEPSGHHTLQILGATTMEN